MKARKPRKLLPGEPEKWTCRSYRWLYRSLAVLEKTSVFVARMYADINNAPYFSPPLPPLLTQERFAESRALLLQDRLEDMPKCQALHKAVLADLMACHEVVTAAVTARAAAWEVIQASQMPPP